MLQYHINLVNYKVYWFLPSRSRAGMGSDCSQGNGDFSVGNIPQLIVGIVAQLCRKTQETCVLNTAAAHCVNRLMTAG